MSAIDAFYAAWTNARRMFGEGTPQGGAQFDASAKLRQLGNDVGRSAPGSVWSGGAATAYEATSASHRAFIDRIADLDQQQFVMGASAGQQGGSTVEYLPIGG